jgi:hypothetical protein
LLKWHDVETSEVCFTRDPALEENKNSNEILDTRVLRHISNSLSVPVLTNGTVPNPDRRSENRKRKTKRKEADGRGGVKINGNEENKRLSSLEVRPKKK